jgi:hypothetical protein
MIVTWEVIRKDDGTYDILCDGTAVCTRVPDRWLEKQLGIPLKPISIPF